MRTRYPGTGPFAELARRTSVTTMALLAVSAMHVGATQGLLNQARDADTQLRAGKLSSEEARKLAQSLEKAMAGHEGKRYWFTASESVCRLYSRATAYGLASKAAMAALAMNPEPKRALEFRRQAWSALTQLGRHQQAFQQIHAAWVLADGRVKATDVTDAERNVWLGRLLWAGKDVEKALKAAGRDSEMPSYLAEHASAFARGVSACTAQPPRIRTQRLVIAAEMLERAGHLSGASGDWAAARRHFGKGAEILSGTGPGRGIDEARFRLRALVCVAGSLDYQKAHRGEFATVLAENRDEDWFLSEGYVAARSLPTAVHRLAVLGAIADGVEPGKQYPFGDQFYLHLAQAAEGLAPSICTEACAKILSDYPDSRRVRDAKRVLRRANTQ